LVHQLAQKGLIYLQDEASQLVAQVLGAQAGDRILDVCAAPGSKTTHVAGLAPRAAIVGGDLRVQRLRTLSKLAARQGLAGISLVAYDATRPLPFADGSFDCVLVDAPCTGTGTLRRNPEIKGRISAQDIVELSAKQALILRNASRKVTIGGRLVYSTCSIEPEENEAIVEGFLNENSSFQAVRAEVDEALQTRRGAVRTWPHRHDVDGFFIAVFRRS
jgi:16S rRNA (cytosine967-C5)-methyltransferase